MKTLKAISIAAILALAFSVPAYAGEVETPGFTSPPPATLTGGNGATDLAPSEDVTSSGFEEIWFALISLF